VPHSSRAAAGGGDADTPAPVSGPARAHARLWHRPPSFVYAARFHPASPGLVVTGAFDRGVRLWDARTDAAPAPGGGVLDGELLGFVGADPRDAARRAAAGPYERQSGHSAHVNVVEFDAGSATVPAGGTASSGSRLITADASGAIMVWDASGRGDAADLGAYALLRELRPAALKGVPIVAVRVRPGANQMLVLGHQNVLRLFDLTTFTALRAFPNAHCSSSRLDAAFSPDGRYIAAGSEDGALALWEVDTGAVVPARATVQGGRRAVIGYPAPLFGVAWHPTQHLVAMSAFGSGYQVLVCGTDRDGSGK
jgi:jouberin